MKPRLSILVLVLCSVLSAQVHQSPDDLLAKARATYEQSGAKLALPEFETALQAYRAASDRRGEAITLGLIGNCYKHLGDPRRAMELLQSALVIKRELHDEVEQAKTLSNIGLLYWEQGQYNEAIGSYQAGLQLVGEKDARIAGSIHNNLGLVYKERGEYEAALEHYQRALSLHRANHFARGESDTLGNIGGLHADLGHYREALQEYQESTDVAEREGLKPSVMQNLGNMGLIYTALGRVPDALSAFDRASALAAEEGLKREEGDWHKGKGSALALMGKYDAALEEFRLAERIYVQASAKRQEAEISSDRGELYLVIGDLSSATQQFSKALQFATQIGYAEGIQSASLELAELEQRRGRFTRAQAYIHRALERSNAEHDDASASGAQLQLAALERAQKRFIEANRAAQNALQLAQKMGSPLLQARAEVESGEVSLARGEASAAIDHFREAASAAQSLTDSELQWQIDYAEGRALERLQRFEAAVDAYRRAVAQIESVREQLREERFRAGYLQSRYDVYIALVRLLIRLHRLDDAFSYSERLRAQSYLDLLYDRIDVGASPELRELQARIRHLQSAVVAEQSKSQQEQRSLSTFSAELAKAESRYQELLDDLRSRAADSPIQRGVRVFSTREVSAALPADAALLEYVVGSTSTSLLCVTPRGVFGTSLPVRSADLTAKVELFRDLISDVHHDDWRAPAMGLYRQLIAPAVEAGWLRGVQRLYLVPHGILHYLPFAALQVSSNAKTTFLVEHYSLKELPSASMLLAVPAVAEPAGTLLSVAPAQSRLPFASREAESVARLFPRTSRVLIGSSATKERFTHIAGQYGLLHLATHGYFDRLNPMFSGIQLEPQAGDDGTLHVYEIMALHLHARLVTLSACETALGSGLFSDLPPGDEFVGLTRAFLTAGSRSVMATLWKVNDRSTVTFMLDFYRRSGEADSTVAMSQAQRAMAESDAYRHPYYWAAFVMSGIGK